MNLNLVFLSGVLCSDNAIICANGTNNIYSGTYMRNSAEFSLINFDIKLIDLKKHFDEYKRQKSNKLSCEKIFGQESTNYIFIVDLNDKNVNLAVITRKARECSVPGIIFISDEKPKGKFN